MRQLFFLLAESWGGHTSSRDAGHSRDDTVLLAEIAGGDAQAFEELFDRYKGLIYSQSLRILKDPGLSEEVTLDVFNQIWQRARGYQPARAAVKTWLVRIARNRAIDVLRMRRSRLDANHALWAEDALESLAGDSNPEFEIEQQDLYRKVSDFLQTLPEEQLIVLKLAYFHGLSHSQIAEQLKQPLGTVKGRIRVAMRSLQTKFMHMNDI